MILKRLLGSPIKYKLIPVFKSFTTEHASFIPHLPLCVCTYCPTTYPP